MNGLVSLEAYASHSFLPKRLRLSRRSSERERRTRHLIRGMCLHDAVKVELGEVIVGVVLVAHHPFGPDAVPCVGELDHGAEASADLSLLVAVKPLTCQSLSTSRREYSVASSGTCLCCRRYFRRTSTYSLSSPYIMTLI